MSLSASRPGCISSHLLFSFPIILDSAKSPSSLPLVTPVSDYPSLGHPTVKPLCWPSTSPFSSLLLCTRTPSSSIFPPLHSFVPLSFFLNFPTHPSLHFSTTSSPSSNAEYDSIVINCIDIDWRRSFRHPNSHTPINSRRTRLCSSCPPGEIFPSRIWPLPLLYHPPYNR